MNIFLASKFVITGNSVYPGSLYNGVNVHYYCKIKQLKFFTVDSAFRNLRLARVTLYISFFPPSSSEWREKQWLKQTRLNNQILLKITEKNYYYCKIKLLKFFTVDSTFRNLRLARDTLYIPFFPPSSSEWREREREREKRRREFRFLSFPRLFGFGLVLSSQFSRRLSTIDLFVQR